MACCDNTTDDWPVEKAAEYLLAQLEEVRRANPGQRVAVIADGEVSSPVRGKGIGGRNAAFVLACVKKIAGKKITVLSAGTDGVDGNSPAAGAVADGETFERGQAIGLNARYMFRESDSYSYFARLGDTIITGPTGNNLRDLRILLADAEEKKQKRYLTQRHAEDEKARSLAIQSLSLTARLQRQILAPHRVSSDVSQSDLGRPARSDPSLKTAVLRTRRRPQTPPCQKRRQAP